MTTRERQELEPQAPYTVMVAVVCMGLTLGLLLLGAVCYFLRG